MTTRSSLPADSQGHLPDDMAAPLYRHCRAMLAFVVSDRMESAPASRVASQSYAYTPEIPMAEIAA
jgi:hypothetical protein